MSFQVPSTLWVTILLIVPPMLIPWIEQFFPTNTYWWSALVVVLLNATVLVVKVNWGGKPVPTTPPGVQADAAPASPAPSGLAKLLIWGA